LINSKNDAFLSKKLATIELNVDIPNFNLENYKFLPETYLTPEVKDLFRKLEFFSLLQEDAPKKKTWEDLKIDVKII
jgi:5'-3' exonuclease